MPVNLFSTISLTNFDFILAYPTSQFTNWNITSTNSAIGSATAQMVDPSHELFSIGVQPGQALRGSNGIGVICLDILPGQSSFAPLAFTGVGLATPSNAPTPYIVFQNGRVVVIDSQVLLEGSLDASGHRILVLYGNPGVCYQILCTTNLGFPNSWNAIDEVILTNLFQIINLENQTNSTEFFQTTAWRRGRKRNT